MPLPSNKLIFESSPYLLQHAHNPVNWYPWGNEAFDRAEKEDKPIIISIGYSACHWCHVMEKESFEDEAIAEFMNQHFICIKVDREERPDVDQVYMHAVQLMQGNGGWPLNAFALPDRRPFWGGTYFPPTSWMKVLEQIVEIYEDGRERLEEQASNIAMEISKPDLVGIKAPPEGKLQTNFEGILLKFYRQIDRLDGGFGSAPKFPQPVNFEFLLKYHILKSEEDLKKLITLSLDKMAHGGIYDHLGGGFARYSVDERWKVPHFEKMLYDNAQLISLYSRAYKVFDKEIYRRVVRESLDYIGREMTNPEGMFYSALDADSEGEEGKYYVWTGQEIDEILGPEASFFKEVYGVDGNGYWEEGKNILVLDENPEKVAEKYGIERDILPEKMLELKGRLFHQRLKRPGPGLDDKSLTSWNCMMVKAYLDAFLSLEEETLLDTAIRSMISLRDNIKTPSDGLLHSWKNGKASVHGFLEDYAHYADANFRLYEITLDEQWLNESLSATAYAIEHLYDESTGFFFFNPEDSLIIARKHETYDSVIPSSNSVMFRILLRLGIIFDRADYIEMVKKACFTIKEKTEKYPSSHANWASLLLEVEGPFYVVAICGSHAVEKAMIILHDNFPNKLITGSLTASDQPYLKDRYVEGRTMIYTCKDKLCKLPVSSAEEAISQMT